MKNWKMEAVILAIGMVLLGLMIRGGINDVKDKERIVTVKGLAEMEVPADKVTWPLMYKDIGNDLPALYMNMEKKNQAIVSFLKSNGITDEEISVAPSEIIDMKAERYSNENVTYRYNATSVITVTSRNVDKVRKLMSEQTELLKQGIAITGGDYRYNVSYEFTGLNDIKPQMIEEATKNARAAAEKFAKDSESELGKIKKAYQHHGYGYLLEGYLINELLKQKKVPYCQVVEGNEASLALQRKLHMKISSRYSYWVFDD